MKFGYYPHDEQTCRMKMESCKLIDITSCSDHYKILHPHQVSHTTDDMVFLWHPEEKVPLFVDPSVELPQLELISNVTGDCTSVYSTGANILRTRWKTHIMDFILRPYHVS